MSDNLPWKTWTPDDLAPPQAEFVPMVEPEETIIEEAEPSLEQQLAQLQMQAHEQGYQAGIAEGRQQGHEQGYQDRSRLVGCQSRTKIMVAWWRITTWRSG